MRVPLVFFCLKAAFAAFKVGIVKGKPLVEIKAPVKWETTGEGYGYIVLHPARTAVMETAMIMRTGIEFFKILFLGMVFCRDYFGAISLL